MKYKNYIAILLAAIIFTKFVAFDSKLLGTFFNSDDITFVNQSCKFDNFQLSPVQENFSEDSYALNISYHSFCNSMFNFEFSDWTDEFEELNFHSYGLPVIGLTTSYNSKISPPPQF